MTTSIVTKLNAEFEVLTAINETFSVDIGFDTDSDDDFTDSQHQTIDMLVASMRGHGDFQLLCDAMDANDAETISRYIAALTTHSHASLLAPSQ